MAKSVIIKELAKALNLKIYKLEEVLEVSNGTIRNSIKRNAELSTHLIGRILDKYPNVNKDWLLTGDGNIFQEKVQETEQQEDIIKEYKPPVVTAEFLLERLRLGYALNYSDSVEIRMISDFAARLVIEGKMDIGDRKAHIEMLMEYSKIYLLSKTPSVQ